MVKRLEPSIKGNEETSQKSQLISLKFKDDYQNKNNISLNLEESLDSFEETQSSVDQTAKTAGDSSDQVNSTINLGEKNARTASRNGQDVPTGQTARTSDDSSGQVNSTVNRGEKNGRTASRNSHDVPKGQTARTTDDSSGQVNSTVNQAEKDG